MSKTIEDFCEYLQSMPRKDHEQLHGRLSPISVYDFHVCVGRNQLAKTIQTINDNRYVLIGASQDDDVYTVFFLRPRL